MNQLSNNNCTCFPDIILEINHSVCCKLHDFNYGKQHISRWTADKRFFKCLKKKTYLLVAVLMWLGVRAFGWYWWNKSKRSKSMTDISTAILYADELTEHLEDVSNHRFYQRRNDDSITVWMCCDFEIVDSNIGVVRGGCGDGINYNLIDKSISIERR